MSPSTPGKLCRGGQGTKSPHSTGKEPKTELAHLVQFAELVTDRLRFAFSSLNPIMKPWGGTMVLPSLQTGSEAPELLGTLPLLRCKRSEIPVCLNCYSEILSLYLGGNNEWIEEYRSRALHSWYCYLPALLSFSSCHATLAPYLLSVISYTIGWGRQCLGSPVADSAEVTNTHTHLPARKCGLCWSSSKPKSAVQRDPFYNPLPCCLVKAEATFQAGVLILSRKTHFPSRSGQKSNQ